MTGSVKVLGLSAEKGRWILVALGLVMNLCLGTVYSWSVFRKPLEKFFMCGATESGLPYMVFLAFFAMLMPVAGRWLNKYGPRIISMLGGVVVGVGWILSMFANSMLLLTVSYGMIAGGGVGVVYGGPIAVATKWFPDKKGLAVGLTLVGFGLSPLITAPLSKVCIDLYGALRTFGILGVVFLVTIVLLATPMKFPPAGWKPSGWEPSKATVDAVDIDTSKMLRTPTFYGLWICYVIGTLSGLMAIGISSPVGQEVIALDAAMAAMAVSTFAIFNGIGRPLFGWITDRLTPRFSAIIAFVIITAASIGMLSAGKGDVILYMVCFSGFWLTLGGWLAIAPTSTATFFGTKYNAKNYGVVFTAYGIGAILGTLVSGSLRDLFGSYIYAFYPTAALAIVGIIIAVLLLRPPKK